MSEEDYRFNKIDDAIQRLASVATDLSKMLAVHEQRISQQERFSDTLGTALERRRDEVDKKFESVYETIKTEDQKLLKEIKDASEQSTKQLENLSLNISKIEKMLWMAIGGGAVLGFSISLLVNLAKFIK
jgi:seryl-tRNA synthetase